jgi:glycosyltransferase involved in cell wall biosynthesis
VHIALINHYAGSPKLGMEFRPHQLARRWVAAGHDVTILAGSYSHLRNQNPIVTKRVTEELIDGIRYRWLRTPTYSGNGLGRIRSIHAFLRGVDRERKRFFIDHTPDCVIASSTYPFDIDPARRLATAHDAPLIWEVHDLWPLSPIELGGYSPKHPFIRAVQRAEDRACREATKVISILPKAIDHLRTRGLEEKRFRVVPNGVDLDDSSPLPPALTSPELDTLRKKAPFLIGYAGGLSESYGLETLLRAASQVDDIGLVFIGDGPDVCSLQAMAQKLCPGRVVFFPRTQRREALATLASFDATFVGLRASPLFRFGIGMNKIFDAMLVALPVLACYTAGNDPIGDSGCGLTTPAGDSEKLADGLRKLQAMSSEQRAVLGNAGDTYVRKHHNYDVLAESFLEEIASC